MSRIILWLAMALLILAISGCAGAPEQPSPIRQALVSLSERAAQLVLKEPVWNRPTTEVVILLSAPKVDASLGIDTERLHENLTRALLAQQKGPQVLDWTPVLADTEAPDNQWLLKCELVSDGPRLTLSDRDLLPYRLTLSLRRPGEEAPRWQRHISGAIDVTTL
ncbi:hypothetical protein L861_05650 [Litchfieldella anticariensis FP35 = DSM 16096]|uniref:Uncharacterized protein n=1 Tax=Litchfieldella anticariensis (strain DSM 16096 / CECT 5854 / CIP 108499 / LMG 22089 / FP35) TaxID=1121939 RepID=S2KG60_LITA3|nr:hypothetical protein [Halomonas anticariensis]EPC00885.1 hypothetical protein L861_05650 [Halomonas anticariensis FP35 = DSM 16096]